jgi:hypothetical protein
VELIPHVIHELAPLGPDKGEMVSAGQIRAYIYIVDLYLYGNSNTNPLRLYLHKLTALEWSLLLLWRVQEEEATDRRCPPRMEEG